jgi:polyphosphate kinase
VKKERARTGGAGSRSTCDHEKDTGAGPAKISLGDPSLYINRELSWIRFNHRVLEEAQDPGHPLLERVKFLAICGSNFDEFFMIRVSGLMRQLMKGALKAPPDGMTPSEQLAAIRREVEEVIKGHGRCWSEQLLPSLREAGVRLHSWDELDKGRRKALRAYFRKLIFPTLTPLALDLTHPFPFISNLSPNLAVVMRDHSGKERFARLKIPTNLFPRFIRVPNGDENGSDRFVDLVMLEDLVIANIDLLFPGLEVEGCYPFRITRDAEIEIVLDEASDLLTAVEESVESRRSGFPSRLQVDRSMPDHLVELFRIRLGLGKDMVYKHDAPLGLVDLWHLMDLERPDLKDAPFIPYTPPTLAGKDILSSVRERDYVLYHPYDSFGIMVNMLRQAAQDPNVLAIKITLYRIDKGSPVIDALMEARENGKAVAALVELKAKFDEQNNIVWAKALEEAGVHVVYGLVDLKVHAKLLLIVRREASGIVRYSHISSGNYNASTARIYGDMGYLTADERTGEDLADLFNALTGYSEKEDYTSLLVAPNTLMREILKRIDREIQVHHTNGNGRIAIKINGLLEKSVIQALYRASREGVRIDLNVRGLCALRPGIPGVSENITVNSIVDRFLEHARIYYFRNDGNEEMFLGSADMMQRNLFRRVEALVPVKDKRLIKTIHDNILMVHLKDNVKSRILQSDGTYIRREPTKGEKKLRSQAWLIENRGVWHGEDK